MSSFGVVNGLPRSFRVKRVELTSAYAKVSVESNPIDFTVVKSPEYLAKFPLGKIPSFEKPDGFKLVDSIAISFYLASQNPKSGLLGQSAEETAKILQYCSFAEAEIGAALTQWLAPIFFPQVPLIKPVQTNAIDNIKKFYGFLNSELLDKTFLVGNSITLADLALAPTIIQSYQTVIGSDMRKEYTNLNRYITTLINQDEFKQVYGGVVEFIDKAMVYTPPKKEEKPKKEKPAKQVEEVPEVSEAPKKPKSKLDLLPPTPFNLEDWKRFYSNNNTKPDAMDYFWKNFDPQGYSLWRVDYKYNDELTLVFMSSNLIGGFFNRLERARKYAFGSMIILGEDNNNAIAGYFVIRGQEVPEEITDAADFDSYNFVKVDPNDSAVRKEVEDFFAWDGDFGGRSVADGKVFK